MLVAVSRSDYHQKKSTPEETLEEYLRKIQRVSECLKNAEKEGEKLLELVTALGNLLSDFEIPGGITLKEIIDVLERVYESLGEDVDKICKTLTAELIDDLQRRVELA